MTHPGKQKVAIIGAGAAGLLTAWLLEQECEVSLFEKEDRLGGHIATKAIDIDGEMYHIEAGAEFFSYSMSTTLTALLEILKVPIKPYNLTYTFYNTNTKKYMRLPPLPYRWSEIDPAYLFNLVQFHTFINSGKGIVENFNTQTTLWEYAKEIRLSDEFINHFLIPFFTGSWGCSLEDMKRFSAYDILIWSTENKLTTFGQHSWYEIQGGAQQYITALVQQIPKAHIIFPAHIHRISHTKIGYEIFYNDTSVTFDHIIIATNAYDAQKLLAHIPHTHAMRAALQNFEFFYTTIAVHSDIEFMPPDSSTWSIANIRYDGKNAANTIYKPWLSKKDHPLFRSWISQPIASEPSLPKNIYYLEHFYHPKVTPNYFKGQKMIQQLQGLENIWFAGMYTTQVDAHNSALLSACLLAKKLDIQSQRLAKLMNRVS